jgi:hypothetical protein
MCPFASIHLRTDPRGGVVPLENEQRVACFTGILPKAIFGVVVLIWLVLALLRKQKLFSKSSKVRLLPRNKLTYLSRCGQSILRIHVSLVFLSPSQHSGEAWARLTNSVNFTKIR